MLVGVPIAAVAAAWFANSETTDEVIYRRVQSGSEPVR
jgi:hypothetical protein